MMNERKAKYLKGFGERIANRRKELGYSQEELAKKLGYKSRSTINKIELGKNDIPQYKILEFAAALEMPVEDLMAYEQTEPGSIVFEDALEEELIENFRKLTVMNKGQVIGMVRGFLVSQEDEIDILKAQMAKSSTSKVG